MDFTNSNRAMRQMLQLMMQRMMGEESLERQKEYVDYSSDVYGRRQQENLAATEASRLRVGEAEHGRTMEEKAADLNKELLKMPRFDRLSRQYALTPDPKQREAIATELATGAELFGTAAEARVRGEQIPASLWEKLYGYGDISDVENFIAGAATRLNTIETNRQTDLSRQQRESAGARTAGLQERRLGFDREKLTMEHDKLAAKGAPGAVAEKPKFQAIVTAADKAQAALLKAMELGEGEEGDLAAVQAEVAKIKNKGIIGGWPNRAAQERDLAFLEKIYSPAKAAESLRARDWVAEQDAARAASRATPTPVAPSAPDRVSELTIKLVARGVPREIARQMAEEYFRGR